LTHGAPRVTILLPTHNRADVLGHAIQSALWQTERDFELLIVGDGCTDTTRDVIAAFPDPRIRWFDLPKAPLSGYANRNFALRQARGRYVAYAQHDDILFPDHVERLIATIDSSGADWTYSRPLWVMPDGVVIPFSINLTHRDELDHFLNVENHVPSTCVMHTRSALERVGFWPEDVPREADWRCWQRIIMTSASGAVGHCRVPTALHFRAVWKQGDSPLERRLRDIAESTWWPAILCHPPAAEPEQATIWRAIQIGGAPWIAALRAATDTVIDRIAWLAERNPHPHINAALAAQAKAEAAAETARAEVDALRAAQAKAEAAAEMARAEVDALRAAQAKAEAAAETARAEVDALRAAQAKSEAAAETARAEVDALRAAQAKAEAAAETARAVVDALRASTSWRITAPLRSIARRFRK
jgi:pyruvate/2-oxoglutarate dehydrogenase complex dihydrolipoamide acyltransferase (E2) component